MSVQKSNMPRQGVVKFTPEQLNNVVDAILSTANKVQVPRCGASYLLFMALRHTDNTNDDNLLKVRTLPCSGDRAIYIPDIDMSGLIYYFYFRICLFLQ